MGGRVRQVCPPEGQRGTGVDRSEARVPTLRWLEGWTNQSYTPTHVRFVFLPLQSKMYLLWGKTLQCFDDV